jgi:hypothetical protein
VKRPARIVEAIISMAVLVLWGYVQLVLMRDAIPDGNRDLVLRMLGVLDAAVLMVLGYWLGTSVGSARKTDMLVHQGHDDDHR